MISVREKFFATLDRMALGEPTATRVEDEGFRAWIAPGDPPVANFAVPLTLDPWSARRLADLAAAHRKFRIYHLPTELPEPVPEILDRAGFVVKSEAKVMLAAQGGDPGALIPEEDEDGRETAAFIAGQFFARSNPSRRDSFARAIAQAPDTRLLSVRDRGGIVAALMLSATRDTLGIYNLCVAPRKRGAGVGTEVVRWVRAYSPLPITLQCDPRLEAWYRKIGFRSVGALRFFCLASARDSDTI